MHPTFSCPICQLTLEKRANKYSCESNHSFDMAKEGYVNLLLDAMKNSKEPGDSKEMMRARSDFLSKGHYFPLVEAINSAILESHCGARSILDAGCGEGYYLDSLSKLRSSSPSACLTGIDISKEGVRRTAKRNPQITAAVASAYQLPFASSSVDFIMSVFSPVCEEEFQRVLAPAGILIVVGPGFF